MVDWQNLFEKILLIAISSLVFFGIPYLVYLDFYNNEVVCETQNNYSLQQCRELNGEARTLATGNSFYTPTFTMKSISNIGMICYLPDNTKEIIFIQECKNRNLWGSKQ